MLAPRISPCLLVADGGLVKTIGFRDAKYVGDPINAVKIFNEKEVDELIVLDIDASANKSEPDYSLIKSLAAECQMPLCYGGGVKTVEQAKRIVGIGVEKVSISSGAVETPELLRQVALEIGSQSVVGVLDVRRRRFSNEYRVWIHNGRKKTGYDAFEFAEYLQTLGVGELIFNSIDRDGTMMGYDLEFAKKMRASTRVPISFIGGAGSLEDMTKLVETCGVVGVSAGSFFVFKGKHRAVLINYPNTTQKNAITKGAFIGAP